MEKYIFREYDPVYKEYFDQEKNQIRNLLGRNIFIEHIGSTAIENLGGKGIIDVLVGVPQGSNMEETKMLLDAGKYEFREVASTLTRLFFRRDYMQDGRPRRVHIHVVEHGGEEWMEPVAFRDYLRVHPDLVLQYVQIKKDAVEKAAGDGEKYRAFKHEFIQEILHKSAQGDR